MVGARKSRVVAAILGLWGAFGAASAFGHDLSSPEAFEFLCAFSNPSPPPGHTLVLPSADLPAALRRAHIMAAASVAGDSPRQEASQERRSERDSDHVCRYDMVSYLESELDDSPRAHRAAIEQAYSRQRSMLLLTPHRVQISTMDWEAVGYDEELGLYEISLDEPLKAQAGLWEIAFPAHRRVFFDVPAWQIEDIRKRRGDGNLPLRVTFRLRGAEAPETEICPEVDDGRVQLTADLLVAELMDDAAGEVLVRSQTAVYAAERVRVGRCPLRNINGVPMAVEVPSLDVRGEEAVELAEIEVLEMSIETALTACYMKGLLQNGQLQGAMVVRAQVNEDGHLNDAEILIDALHNESVRRCTLSEVEALRLERAPEARPFELRVPLYFRLLE